MKNLTKIYVFIITLSLVLMPSISMAAGWHDRLCNWLTRIGIPTEFIVWLHLLFGWA
jgi:hypothetical protein